MAFTKILTRNGEDNGEPIGVGFYYVDDRHERHHKLVFARCLSTALPNGGYRRVFYDRDGRAVCTGWFMAC